MTMKEITSKVKEEWHSPVVLNRKQRRTLESRSLHLLPNTKPTFIVWQNQINSVFEDQDEHIIKPVVDHAKKCLITN